MRLKFSILISLLIVVFIIAIGVGSVFIPPLHVLKAILAFIGFKIDGVSDEVLTIVTQIRLPRIIVAMTVGMALSLAGTIIQGIFRNPMAEPGIIGISSGASLGAITSIALGLNLINIYFLPLLSFIGGLLSSIIVYLLSTKRGKTPILHLILIGLSISTLLSSISSIILSNINQYQVNEYIFWMLGGLDGRSWWHVKISFLPILIILLISILFSKKINILVLGEDEAYTLGVNPELLKKLLLLLTSLITGIAVSVSGTISFVGLIVPHIMRIIVGPDYRKLIPSSVIGGGIFLIICDSIARMLFSPIEVKVGIVTSIVGVPYFLYLLKSRGAEYSL
ncbi:FecCD family ABC transporter permease [Caldicellulosiruptoraceae bacterium PP1]